MFNSLTESLDKAFRKIRGVGKISEKNITEALREVRMSLLEADVDFKVAREFIASVKEKAMGTEVMKSVKPGDLIVKIFQDELTELLGGDAAPINLDPPGRILMVGLNGAGKTTTSAKLALKLKKDNRRPLLVALDLYRPAAIEQLATLGEEIGVPVYKPDPGEKNLVKAAKKALKWVSQQIGSVVIFDTAGRQEVNEELIKELEDLNKFLNPKEVLLVADAATGQQAVSVAKHFDEAVGITGLVLTKLDGDSRGGAALSMRQVTGKPIKYAGVGEKMDQLDVFHPDRMAQRILDMGDIVTLVEGLTAKIDEKEAERMQKRMEKNKFDFNDFLNQLKMMQSLGPLEGILGMLPGAKKMMKNVQVDESRIKRVEAIVLSMTKKERARPEILNGSRRKRISLGSGTKISEVNNLIKQFGQMRKMMRSKGKMRKMMAALGGGDDLGGMGGGGGGMPGLPKGLGM